MLDTATILAICGLIISIGIASHITITSSCFGISCEATTRDSEIDIDIKVGGNEIEAQIKKDEIDVNKFFN